MKPAIFLDRDGVLNCNVLRDGRLVSPRTFAEFELLPGVVSAVLALKTMGFFCIVVTNQPDITRQQMAPVELETMHTYLQQTVPLDDILVCPHDDNCRCVCRKPQPGLLYQATQKWLIHLPTSWMVGDRLSDIQAGQAVGCRTIAIGSLPEAEFMVTDLAAAVEVINTVWQISHMH